LGPEVRNRSLIGGDWMIARLKTKKQADQAACFGML
jgi:hypothetical protein